MVKIKFVLPCWVLSIEPKALQRVLLTGALANFGGNWSVEELNKFLLKTKQYIEGTKMNFNGLKKDQDRADLIEYLSSLAD